MLEIMPFRVWQNWQRYYAAEPFGEERADYRAAIIAWTFASVMTDKKSRNKIKLDMFMPKFGRQKKRPQTPEDMLEKVKLLNALLGGTIVEKKADGP